MLSSYHHVLKSMWLEGKQNWHADHLIHTLIVNMLPHYKAHHDSQLVGFKGSNLAKKHRKEILTRTLEMNANSIHDLYDGRYSMRLVADQSCTYLVELTKQSCDCPD